MAKKADPILDALATLAPNKGGQKKLLPKLCTPEQLAAVKVARQDRGASFRQIAAALRSGGIVVSESTVCNWLRSEGIE